MNANELADELREVSKHSEPHTQIVLGIAESLLRQQQAEIDRLTMLCDCMTTESNRKGNEIEALKAENSHLKYEISSGAWNPVPLTDAELSKVYEEVYINYAGKDFPVDLGRAILLKAQEKC